MPTEKIIKKLYNGEVEIVFYPNSHQYKLNGENLISVTGATDMLDKSKPLLIWAMKITKEYLFQIKDAGKHIGIKDIEDACIQHTIRREKAADIGTLIHAWAEAYAKGKNPELPSGDDEQSTKILNGVLAFLKWIDENQVKFVETERLIYSKAHKYVGIMDLIFTMGKENHEILHFGDYKTSSGIYTSHLYQMEGYAGAWIEEIKNPPYKIGSSYILRFAKEDKFDKDGNLKEEAGTFEAKEIPIILRENLFQCFLACLALKKMDKNLQYNFFNS